MDKKNKYPWEQLPDEPFEQYDMFKTYINLPSYNRSLQYIAAFFGKSPRTIARYSKKWNWIRRTDQYDKYIRQNYKQSLIDFCNAFEEKKFNLKIELSFLSYEIASNLRSYLDHYEKIYKNDDIIKRLKFFREISLTIKQVFSLADFSLNPEMLRTKLLRDIKNSEKNNDNTYIFNDNKNINLSLNTILTLIKEKTGDPIDIDDIIANDNSNIYNDNDIPPLDLSSVYAIEQSTDDIKDKKNKSP